MKGIIVKISNFFYKLSRIHLPRLLSLRLSLFDETLELLISPELRLRSPAGSYDGFGCSSVYSLLISWTKSKFNFFFSNWIGFASNLYQFPAMELSDFSVIEERLRVLLRQLQTESGILERIVYKNKNQHRRCPYFKSLLKVCFCYLLLFFCFLIGNFSTSLVVSDLQVRRDVNLLNSAMLGDVLSVLFPIIDGKKPAQKAFFISRWLFFFPEFWCC